MEFVFGVPQGKWIPQAVVEAFVEFVVKFWRKSIQNDIPMSVPLEIEVFFEGEGFHGDAKGSPAKTVLS